MITKYESNCFICGRPVDTDVHHLVMGNGNKQIADRWGLTAPICRKCHTELHANAISCTLSRICGQLLFEKNIIEKEGVNADEARERFRQSFGVSYL